MAGSRTRRTNLEMIKGQVAGLKNEVERKKERQQRLRDRIEYDSLMVNKLEVEITESEQLIASLS